MGRMGRDTEQDRIGQADTNQKSACGKPESGKQEAPRLWGKRTANSSEIVHTVLGQSGRLPAQQSPGLSVSGG